MFGFFTKNKPKGAHREVAHKHCPFCKGVASLILRRKAVTGIQHITRYDYFVFCEGCGARGPEKGTEAQALLAWNKRPV